VNAGKLEMAKNVSLEGLPSSMNGSEQFELVENQAIVADLIRVGLAQGIRGKLLNRESANVFAVVLAPVDLRPGGTVVPALDRPALEGSAIWALGTFGACSAFAWS
jgi:hypothetical protein